MAWKSLPLLGRATELALLEQGVRQASAGRFRCVLLVGEPGVGKSRLAAEILTRNRRRAVSLSARAYPLGGTTPFGLWAEALEGHLRSRSPEDVVRLCGGLLDDLSALLRSVASVRGAVLEREPSRQRLLDGLVVLVQNLASEAPVLVLLDDIHQSDASSLEALSYLARHLSEARVFVVACARPAELLEQRPAGEILFGLEQEGTVERLQVAPLQGGAVADLAGAAIGRPPSQALVRWLVDRSRGNALYALALLQTLVEEAADLDDPGICALPEGLATSIRTRIRSLDESAAGVLEFIALLGRRVELSHLARLSGRSLETLCGALDRSVRLRVLAEEQHETGVTYEIAHPLVQEAIYEGIGSARRRALHRQAARNLLACGLLAEAAPHFARSAERGDPEAIDVLRAAVEQAEARGAYREALLILDAIVQLLPAGDPRWLEVLDAMAWQADWLIDHRPDAHAVLGIRAMRTIDAVAEQSTEPSRRAAVKLRLMSFLAWGPGELAEAEQVCRQAIDLLLQAGDRTTARLATNELAWIQGLRGDWAGMAATAQAVAADARAESDRRAEMRAAAAMGFSALWRGSFAAGEEAFHRSLSIARDDGQGYERCRSLSGLAPLIALEGRTSEALSLLREGRSSSGVDVRDSLLVEYGAIVQWLAGEFPAALESARQAVAANLIGKRRAIGLVFGALAAAETGDTDEGRRNLAIARVAYRDGEWALFGDYGLYAEAILQWRETDAARAFAQLQEASALVARWDMPPFVAFPLLDLAEAALEADDPAAGAEAADRLTAIATGLGRDLYRALALVAGALAHLAAGRPQLAAEPAAAGAELLGRSGCGAFEGRALSVLGQALGRCDPARALATFGRAAAIFDCCGAQWRRGRVLEAMEALGQRGRRLAVTVAGPKPLSPREREVARLASRGLTSREIAERLFLSERTIESHLARAYGKLGVRSRAELAGRAGELHL